ncbi:hypothetical protein [Clostridium cavendishii]|uniref:hypothetical protein n=1 Tax=Clostridium cavendishii TaxID=349931 RepID=UPI00093354D7|nr:hypothetical protein [Clostridium cavendishii]
MFKNSTNESDNLILLTNTKFRFYKKDLSDIKAVSYMFQKKKLIMLYVLHLIHIFMLLIYRIFIKDSNNVYGDGDTEYLKDVVVARL